MSRLDGAVSPYLQAHAHQKVDWFPWGPEAFAEAHRRDVPVMISIGYHTCHWCHVMSRESFDNEAIAQAINEHVVAIKVDREEHPDVDEAYMAQAAAFAENLGWPLTVFTTPDGHAFFAATYLPPEPREGLPSLPQVLDAVGKAWSEKREEVLESSRALVEALSVARAGSGGSALPERSQLEAVVEALVDYEDKDYGGFGGAPKFPITPVLHFLQAQTDSGNTEAQALLGRLLDSYSNSALLDPIEGGFFRYATRRDFTEPHYERMLYDNAGLLQAYARAGRRDIASGIVSFLRHQLYTGQGFGSAQDSESIIDGKRDEGGYYRRSAQERASLEPPAIDTKIVTGWNGLALESLALAHRLGCEGQPIELARDVASWIVDHHLKDDGQLHRVSRDGRLSNAPATLEDYGGLACGLIELGLALGETRWVVVARDLIDLVIALGGRVPGDSVLSENGVSVAGSLNEGASPSGETLVARACLRLHSLTGAYSYRDFARELVSPFVAQAMANPTGMGGILEVVTALSRPSRELIVVEEEPSELGARARQHLSGDTIVAVLTPAQSRSFVEAGFSVFEGRDLPDVPVAFVCEGGVCQMPVSSVEAIESLLTQ